MTRTLFKALLFVTDFVAAVVLSLLFIVCFSISWGVFDELHSCEDKYNTTCTMVATPEHTEDN